MNTPEYWSWVVKNTKLMSKMTLISFNYVALDENKKKVYLIYLLRIFNFTCSRYYSLNFKIIFVKFCFKIKALNREGDCRYPSLNNKKEFYNNTTACIPMKLE